MSTEKEKERISLESLAAVEPRQTQVPVGDHVIIWVNDVISFAELVESMQWAVDLSVNDEGYIVGINAEILK